MTTEQRAMITDERLAEMVGAGAPCVPAQPGEIAAVVQELRRLRSQPAGVSVKGLEGLRRIVPYLDWTISEESPGYHPTMPSAVAAFKDALSALETQEEEAVAWVTADILAAMKRGERAVPGWKRSADFCIPLYAGVHTTPVQKVDEEMVKRAVRVLRRTMHMTPEERARAALTAALVKP